MQITKINTQTMATKSNLTFGTRPIPISLIENPNVQPSAEEAVTSFLNPFTAQYGTEGLKELLRKCQELLPKKTEIKATPWEDLHDRI